MIDFVGHVFCVFKFYSSLQQPELETTESLIWKMSAQLNINTKLYFLSRTIKNNGNYLKKRKKIWFYFLWFQIEMKTRKEKEKYCCRWLGNIVVHISERLFSSIVLFYTTALAKMCKIYHSLSFIT